VVAFRPGVVVELLSERPGLQRVTVRLGGAGSAAPEGAYVLTQLTGPVAVGHEVVVNTTAVDLGLGTGGWHVVHWNLSRAEYVAPGPGHIMKLRYSSLQVDTGAAEEHDPHVPDHLGALPVAVCGLHSQMGVVATVARAVAPEIRLVYVMTDGAALPLALSDLVARLRQLGVLDHTITAGNAFGGDVEAVTVPSALTWARHRLGADAVVVSMGPGITGTSSPLGTTGIEVASILDQVAALDGRGLLVLRTSGDDPRPRHRGVSHHSRTAMRLARSRVTVACDVEVPLEEDHDLTVLVPPEDVGTILDRAGVVITTMGRGPDQDPAFFGAAGAAGALLARWAGY
jgi:hypothetical protein